MSVIEDMVIDNDPSITRNISVPRDMSQLSCSSFTAGIVEAVLDGLGFVSALLGVAATHAHPTFSPRESPLTIHRLMVTLTVPRS